jgi:hypothetical protein
VGVFAAWVGDEGDGSGGGAKKPVETELVPLVAPGQAASNPAAAGGDSAEQQQQAAPAVSMGRKLGDGSYVPAPQQQQPLSSSQAGEQSEELRHDAASRLAQPGSALLGAGGEAGGEGGSGGSASAAAAAVVGTIGEFDLPKILRHINELNYLVSHIRALQPRCSYAQQPRHRHATATLQTRQDVT